jgi:hypothetical protein
MMATFKESSRRRSWVQRLTPVAWVLIAVVAVSCLAITLIGGGRVISGLFAGDEWATKTPTPKATKAPDPAAGSTGEPTEWWEDGTTTPEPAEVAEPVPFPAWWADEMTQDEDGRWWPPDEVLEDVKDAWYRDVEDIDTHLVDAKPPDYDAYEESATRNFAGPELETVLLGIENRRAGEVPIVAGDYEICLLEVQQFTPDGVGCTMSIACQNGTISYYDPATGELQEQYEEAHSGLVIYKMVYDPHDGYWKRYEVVQYVPPPE